MGSKVFHQLTSLIKREGESDEVDDDQLMKLVAEGQMKSFEILFDRHASKVLGYCQRLVADVAVAEDLSQDAWMKVIRAAPRYQPRQQFVAWVYTIARNTAATYLKKQSRWQLKDDLDELEDAEDISFEDLLSQQSDLDLLKEKMDQLPERQRVVLAMRLGEECSYEEISQSLDLSVSSVKSLLFRARRNLEESLQGATE